MIVNIRKKYQLHLCCNTKIYPIFDQYRERKKTAWISGLLIQKQPKNNPKTTQKQLGNLSNAKVTSRMAADEGAHAFIGKDL